MAYLLDIWGFLMFIRGFQLQIWTLTSNICLSFRAKLDGNDALKDCCDKLEAACVGTVEAGKMTKDLALLIYGSK